MQIFQQAALRPVARMIAALVFFGAARGLCSGCRYTSGSQCHSASLVLADLSSADSRQFGPPLGAFRANAPNPLTTRDIVQTYSVR
jgi:hypothetical protein